MEYPKNNAYCPVSAFKYRGSGAVPFAAETLKAQEHKNTCLDGMSLAMVYSPCQYFEKLYEPMDGLHCGTIFCKLYMPFTGNRR
jgi:hypothetical protein